MKSNSIIKKVVQNSFWSLLSAISSKASLLIVGLIVARLLGPDAFGRFGLIQTAIVLMGSVVSQAMSTAVSKHVAQNFQNDTLKLERGLALTIVSVGVISSFFVALSILSPGMFAEVVLGASDQVNVVYWFILVVIMALLASWVQGVLIGLDNYRSLAVSNIVGALLGVPLAFFLTSSYGVIGALLSVSITHAVSVFFSGSRLIQVLLRYGLVPKFRNCTKELDALSHVGLPVLLTGFMASGAMWLGARVLITGSDGFRALGVFAAASQWNAIFSHISIVLGTVLIPILVQGVDKNARRLESINIVSGWIVVLLLAIPFVTFAGVVSQIYGSAYVGRDFNFVIACVGMTAVIAAFKGGISRRMIAENVAWYSVVSNLIWAMIFVVLVLLYKEKGAVGMGASLVISQGIHFFLTMPFFVKKGFVSKDLVLSWQSLVLWLILPLIFFLLENEESLLLKGGSVFSISLVAVLTAKSLVQRCSKVSP